jgi:hypothetical protein
MLGLHGTKVYWVDEQRQVIGQVFAFYFWWICDRDAHFDGEDHHPKLTEIHDS